MTGLTTPVTINIAIMILGGWMSDVNRPEFAGDLNS
ncbi:hypothetical protein AGR4B_pAt10101 [Agrobacterium tumefaciens str. CFBP 5621]|nr:hypothetical protein AGR4B_pAt10101 [Agrobacterium tumefaciens str. CFBP 5621]